MSSRRKKSTVRTTDSRLDGDARDLYHAVSDLVRTYQFRDKRSICYYDISVTQCYALSALIGHGPMTVNALANELYLDKSTVSRVVGALVRKGYVHRSTEPGDARALRLEATAKGRDLHSRIVQDLIEEMKALVEDYDGETRQALIRVIDRLASAAAKRFARGRQGGPGGG